MHGFKRCIAAAHREHRLLHCADQLFRLITDLDMRNNMVLCQKIKHPVQPAEIIKLSGMMFIQIHARRINIPKAHIPEMKLIFQH